MSRKPKDEYFLDMAKLVSERSTCARRAVGCVLVDNHDHVLATGYNGVPKGAKHCNDGYKCEGADSPSGTDLNRCLAIHAEQNALIQCKDTMSIKAAYLTVNPCEHCLKMLLNTSLNFIYFRTMYPNPILSTFGDIVERDTHYVFVRKRNVS